MRLRADLLINIVAGAVFLSLAALVGAGRTPAFDFPLAAWIQSFSSPGLDPFVRALTHGGDNLTLAVVSLAGALYCRHRQRPWREAIATPLAFAISQAINHLLKIGFQRPRPQLADLFADPSTWSFPSGHAFSSLAVYGSLAVALPAIHPRHGVLLRTLAALLSLGIGLTRIYLDAHWPSDVLAGFALGLLLLSIPRSIYHR
jgi:undecaprenyl-diphosphatase